MVLLRCELWPGPDGGSTCVRAYRTGCIGLINCYRVHICTMGLYCLYRIERNCPVCVKSLFLDRAIRSVQVASSVQLRHGLTGGVPHMSVSAPAICVLAHPECNAATRDSISIKPRLINRHMCKYLQDIEYTNLTYQRMSQ